MMRLEVVPVSNDLFRANKPFRIHLEPRKGRICPGIKEESKHMVLRETAKVPDSKATIACERNSFYVVGVWCRSLRDGYFSKALRSSNFDTYLSIRFLCWGYVDETICSSLYATSTFFSRLRERERLWMTECPNRVLITLRPPGTQATRNDQQLDRK